MTRPRIDQIRLRSHDSDDELERAFDLPHPSQFHNNPSSHEVTMNPTTLYYRPLTDATGENLSEYSEFQITLSFLNAQTDAGFHLVDTKLSLQQKVLSFNRSSILHTKTQPTISTRHDSSTSSLLLPSGTTAQNPPPTLRLPNNRLHHPELGDLILQLLVIMHPLCLSLHFDKGTLGSPKWVS